MASAFYAQLGHLWEGPVIEHEVDIAKAQAGSVELDQDIVGTCRKCEPLDKRSDGSGEKAVAGTYLSQEPEPSLPRHGNQDPHSSITL